MIILYSVLVPRVCKSMHCTLGLIFCTLWIINAERTTGVRTVRASPCKPSVWLHVCAAAWHAKRAGWGWIQISGCVIIKHSHRWSHSSETTPPITVNGSKQEALTQDMSECVSRLSASHLVHGHMVLVIMLHNSLCTAMCFKDRTWLLSERKRRASVTRRLLLLKKPNYQVTDQPDECSGLCRMQQPSVFWQFNEAEQHTTSHSCRFINMWVLLPSGAAGISWTEGEAFHRV